MAFSTDSGRNVVSSESGGQECASSGCYNVSDAFLTLQPHRGKPATKDCSFAVGYRSLSSKVVSQYSNLLSPMAVDSVLKVMDPVRPEL